VRRYVLGVSSERRWEAVALPACLLLAVAVFAYGLGASSLFVDEAASWHAAAGSLGNVLTRVRLDEVAPSTYYLLLHEWIYRSHDASEVWMRLPSMLAGVALAGAVAWLAYLISGRVAACLAALLAALDPAILNYAQQVRAYVFAMLAVTIAAAAVLSAERVESAGADSIGGELPEAGRGRACWFALGLAAAVAGYSLHYTAGLVLLPLTAYVLRSRALSRRLRAVWAVGVSGVALAWLPLLVTQLGAGHNGWLGSMERHWGADLGETFGAALAGRAPETPTRLLIGAAIVCAGVLLALVRARSAQTTLVAVAAILPPVALLVVTLGGQPAMLNRYAAIGVPFVIVSFAVAAVSVALRAIGSSGRYAPLGVRLAANIPPGGEHPGWPRFVAGVLVAGWLALAALGLHASYETIGHYADMRAVVREIRTRFRPGDVVVGVGNEAILFSIEYYATRLLPRGTPVILGSDPRAQAAVRSRRTIWTITPPVSSRQLDAALTSERYHGVATWSFPTMQTLELVEARPRQSP